jgi:hypothetical protein
MRSPLRVSWWDRGEQRDRKSGPRSADLSHGARAFPHLFGPTKASQKPHPKLMPLFPRVPVTQREHISLTRWFSQGDLCASVLCP